MDVTRATRHHIEALRQALFANAVFSSISAAVFLLGSSWLTGWTGAPRVGILVDGAGLVIFVAMILYVLARPVPFARPVLGLAVLIAGLDVLWVLTTPIKIIGYTPAGQWLFGLITLVVLILAVLQIRALAGILRGLRVDGSRATR